MRGESVHSSSTAIVYGGGRGSRGVVTVGAAGTVGDDVFVALATLRTLRGKLAHAAEINPDTLDRMNLTVDANPPDGGEIGGDNLTITPRNFGIVNQAISASGELPILLELVPPAGWRSETEVGRSLETIAQLFPRVERAIERLLARVYASTPARRGRGVAIGAVAWHGVSDADTAGAAIDAQLTAIAKAVVRAAGADESLIDHFYASDVPAVDGRVTDAYRAAQAMRKIGVPEANVQAFLKKATAGLEIDPSHFATKKQEAREKIEKSPYLLIWDAAVSPMLTEWRAWYSDKKHWYDYFTELTEAWQSYTSWAKRVNELRDLVEKQGIYVGVPRMQDFPKSYKDKAEDAAHDAWDFAKIAAYGVLGLGALLGVAVVVNAGKGQSVKRLYR